MINELRFSGLASGMDTESIVKKLMQAERMPLNKILQNKQWQEWQRDTYREVNKTLLDFRSTMEKFRLQSTFTQSKVSSTDTTKLEVSKAGNPSLDSYVISVENLAKPALPASVKFIIDPRLANENEEMKQNFSFEINGKEIKVTDKDTVKGVIDKINAMSSDTGVRATYFQGDNSITLTTTEMSKNANITISETTPNNVMKISNGTIIGTGPSATPAKVVGDPLGSATTKFKDNELLEGLKITVDDVYLDITTLPTVGSKNYEAADFESLAADLEKDINDALALIDAGKSVVVTNNEGRLDIRSALSGSSSEIRIDITEASARLGLAGKFDTGQDDVANFTTNVTKGKDVTKGSVTINGTQHDITSNTFTYDGMKFTLKSSLTVGDTITINKETDTDAIFNDIKSFVDKYNEVIKSLNEKISEKKFRDFKPLLTEQKEGMKDKEIELWDEKAKSGLLQNDSIISSVLMKMRSSLYTMVSGTGVNAKFDTLSEIGIKTSDNYRDNGKLVLDEAKLKEAIANNLEDVKTLFTKTSTAGATSDTTATNSDKYNESGLGWRIYDQINATMKEVTAKAGAADAVDNSLLGKSIGAINDRVDAFERRLSQVENRYWRQFTAMEKAIQKANSQSSWLMQQMGGMGS